MKKPTPIGRVLMLKHSGELCVGYRMTWLDWPDINQTLELNSSWKFCLAQDNGTIVYSPHTVLPIYMSPEFVKKKFIDLGEL